MVIASRPFLMIQRHYYSVPNSFVRKRFLFCFRPRAPKNSCRLTKFCHLLYPGGNRRMICVPGPKRLFTHIILEIEWMIVNSNTGRGQQYSNQQLLKKILAPICVRTQIEDVAFGGAGVARLEGKIVFVPLTVDGDEAEIGIVEKRKT